MMKVALLLPNKAEELLDNWRSLNRNFPFVLIPDQWSVVDLVREKPLLAAAIFASTTAYQKTFQAALDDTVRAAFAKRIWQCGDKSLEVVQALLVYLSYHHQYCKTNSQQIYTYLSTCASIACELGFARQSDHRSYSPSRLQLDCFRAVLGIYYLSTLTAGIDFNLPRPLKGNVMLEHAASALATHAATTTCAKHFPAMVSLLRIAEDMCDSLRQNPAPSTSLALTTSHLSSRLVAWDAPHAAQELTFLTPTRHLLTLVLHQSVLFLPSPPPALEVHSEAAATLSAARLFLDGILASPTLLISLQNMVIFMHIVSAITALCRLCRRLPRNRFADATWDASAQREAACAFDYVDAVIGQMRRQEKQLKPSQRFGLDRWIEKMGHGMANWVMHGGEGDAAAAHEAAQVFAAKRTERQDGPARHEQVNKSGLASTDAHTEAHDRDKPLGLAFWDAWMWDEGAQWEGVDWLST